MYPSTIVVETQSNHQTNHRRLIDGQTGKWWIKWEQLGWDYFTITSRAETWFIADVELRSFRLFAMSKKRNTAKRLEKGCAGDGILIWIARLRFPVTWTIYCSDSRLGRLSAQVAVIPTGTDRLKRGTLWRVCRYAKLVGGDQTLARLQRFAIIDNRASRCTSVSTSSCMVVCFLVICMKSRTHISKGVVLYTCLHF